MNIEKKREMAQAFIDAGSACPEIKEAAQNYIDAIGTDKEQEAAKALVAEAAEDIQPIENSLAFFSSDAGKAHFGEELAAQLVKKAEEVISEGGKYCFCEACTAAKALLDVKEEFIG